MSPLAIAGAAAAALWLCASRVHASAEEGWSRFRGPNGSGVVEAGRLPVELGPARNVVWKASVPSGNSSPILTRDRVFLTAFEGEARLVLCLDRSTGKELWRRSVASDRSERRTARNDAATPSPVTDGDAIYAFFSDFGLISFDSEGRERWRATLGPFNAPHGMATSPILVDDHVILVADQAAGSFIAAFDRRSGRLSWKTERANFVGGYSTPIVHEPRRGDTQVIVNGPLELAAYSARDGRLLWSVTGTGVMPIAGPILADGIVYLNSESVPPFEELAVTFKGDKNEDGKLSPDEFPDPAFRGAVLALDQQRGNKDGFVDAKEWNDALGLARGAHHSLLAVDLQRASRRPGQAVADSVRWRQTKLLSDVPVPLLYRDALFLIKSGGIVSVLNPRTGEVVRQERLSGAVDSYFASPVAADGKLFFLSETGKLVVARAGAADWAILAVNDLGEDCYATPALADGRLYVRTRTTLYAFGEPSSGG